MVCVGIGVGHFVLVWGGDVVAVLEVLVQVWVLGCSAVAGFVLGFVLDSGAAAGWVVQV